MRSAALSGRPAARLLLWCARRFVRGDDGALGQGPPLAGFGGDEWSFFMRETLRHSCLPIVSRTLAMVDGVPATIREDLAKAFEANGRRNLRLAGELVSVTRALTDAGVASVSWKGPLLAERAYGDLRLRQFFDLDLLVRLGDLTTAASVLAKRDFLPVHTLRPEQLAAYVAHMGELELVRASDELWLELHTAVVPSYFIRGRTADDLWQRIRPARLARAQVLALDPADELEALCVHGSKHLWQRLEWIVDIGMLGRRLDAADWARLEDGSRKRGTSRMIDIGVLLAVAVCGARLPDDVVARARADRVAVRLATIAARALLGPAAGRLEEFRFHFRMWDSASDRARYLVNVVSTPSVADWQFMPLPARLAPLYPLVRPLRMARFARRRHSSDVGATDARG